MRSSYNFFFLKNDNVSCFPCLMKMFLLLQTILTRIYSISFSDSLYKDEVSNLVSANRRLSLSSLATLLLNHLKRNYPNQYWVVTVYDPVGTYENHAVIGSDSRRAFKFRYAGVNYVVTRYPKYYARTPRVKISDVVGSVNGIGGKDIALNVLNNIVGKFRARGMSYSSIHIIRKRRSVGWWLDRRKIGIWVSTRGDIPTANYLWKEFSDVYVIVVAPY